jgi:predicted CXXCH cytochrome family protein
VASVALVLTPFGPSQGVALAASSIPMETATVSATPTDTSTPTASATTDSTPTETASPSTTPTPSPSSGTAPGAAPGDHHVIARIEGPELQANYLPVDQPVPDAAQFQTFRVRFRLHNAGADPMTTTPRLEYRPEGSGAYAVVPEQPKVGIPFHVDREWVPSLDLAGGTIQGPLEADIAVADLRIGDGGGLAMPGHRSMGANPDQPITLPSASYTEEEFTVTLSIDAQYLTAYELRITDGGTPLTGTDVAMIHLGAAPDVVLSPGQRQGVEVVDPAPATTAAGAAYPLVLMTSVSAVSGVTAVSAVYRPNTLSYPLVTSLPSAAPAVTEAIHGPFTVSTNACSVCHRGHSGQSPKLLVAGSQSALCFTCHGTAPGALTNVQGEYNPVPALPVNDSTKREYYSHDAVTESNHTRSALDEFGGVLNRHSSCADCHNSHKATIAPADSVQTTAGWTASGRLAGVSGVKVLNGLAGEAPTYTFLSGVNDPVNEDDPVTNVNPITLEYQLCFKCHSGSTLLPAPIANQPSKDFLDKGVEFNPANPSFHPVEAKGTNATLAMQASLDGASPYKLWNFNTTSTVRCLNCHAGGATNPAATPDPLPLPGAALAPHASSNRGILLENYRDRVLKSASEAYSAGDFALCYVCHAEAPFKGSSTATNFNLHAKHVSALEGGTGDTNIDMAGAGQGKAICAECHFRIHSTTNKVGAPGGSRLVSFAPNVLGLIAGGTPSWTPGTTGSGSCALTCHGKTHGPYPYSP